MTLSIFLKGISRCHNFSCSQPEFGHVPVALADASTFDEVGHVISRLIRPAVTSCYICTLLEFIVKGLSPFLNFLRAYVGLNYGLI